MKENPLWVNVDEIVQRDLTEVPNDEDEKQLTMQSVDLLLKELEEHKSQDDSSHKFMLEEIGKTEARIFRLFLELENLRDELMWTSIMGAASLILALVSLGLHIIFS